jgi:hypothetical protein
MARKTTLRLDLYSIKKPGEHQYNSQGERARSSPWLKPGGCRAHSADARDRCPRKTARPR